MSFLPVSNCSIAEATARWPTMNQTAKVQQQQQAIARVPAGIFFISFFVHEKEGKQWETNSVQFSSILLKFNVHCRTNWRRPLSADGAVQLSIPSTNIYKKPTTTIKKKGPQIFEIQQPTGSNATKGTKRRHLLQVPRTSINLIILSNPIQLAPQLIQQLISSIFVVAARGPLYGPSRHVSGPRA